MLPMACYDLLRQAVVDGIVCKAGGEREIYARRPCIVLQRGILGRVPWFKDYTDLLPLGRRTCGQHVCLVVCQHAANRAENQTWSELSSRPCLPM